MKKKTQILIWLFLLSGFFATRLFNLKVVPIFTDEAIYARWAQIALHDSAQRFISLNDGKQPLFIWLAAISQKFITDPLIATRLVSVFAGFGSMIGIYLLSKELFTQKVALISSFLYTVLPFTLLYDRLGLYDSLLTMIGIYSVLLTTKLAKLPNLGNSLLLGLTIGSSLITKSSGIFFLYLLPFSIVFRPISALYHKADRKQFIKWLFFIMLSSVLSMLMYNTLRLSPLFYTIGRKNLEFIRPAYEVLDNPFGFAYGNFTAIVSWLSTYMGWPLFLISVIGIIFGIGKKNLSVIFLSLYILTPFTAEIFFNKVLYPRFALFYFPYLLIIASYFSVKILEITRFQKIAAIIALMIIFMPTLTSLTLLTNPANAKIPTSDSNQYLNDWPAGYGVREIVEYLKNESQSGTIFVGTEGTFGLFPYALELYLQGNNNIEITGFWPVDANKLPDKVLENAKVKKTFFVFNENQQQISNNHLVFVSEYKKGKSATKMRLFRVIL